MLHHHLKRHSHCASVCPELDSGIRKVSVDTGTHQKWMKRLATKTTLVPMILLALFLFSSVKACDLNVKVDTNCISKVCNASGCFSDWPSFKVEKGFEICIEEESGKQMRMEVAELRVDVTYEWAYDTAEFGKDKSLERCECCDRVYDEQSGRVAPCEQCLDDWVKQNWGNTNEVNQFFVNVGGTNRPGKCAIKLGKSRPQEWSYSVLRKSNQVVSLQLIVNGSLETVNDTDGSLNLEKLGVKCKNVISVLKTPSGANPSKSLLRQGDTFYYVNSTEKGRQEKGVIGDIQGGLEMTSNNTLFDIVCERTGDCNANWTVKSAINLFEAQKGNYEKPVNYTVEHRKDIPGAPARVYVLETLDEMYIQVGKPTNDGEQGEKGMLFWIGIGFGVFIVLLGLTFLIDNMTKEPPLISGY